MDRERGARAPRAAAPGESPGERAARVPAQPDPAGRGGRGESPDEHPHGDSPDQPPQGGSRGEHPHTERPRERERPQGPGARLPHRTPAPAVRVPLRRDSVRAQVLTALRTALEAGELAPGEVYSAPALGERLGVSATPVREAMQRLVAEGAVETVPNRGFRVVPRTARDLAELAEIRVLIELPTVTRLVRHLAPERFHELRPLAEESVRAARGGDRAAYAEADRAFHRAVLTLAGNQQLVRFADEVHVRARFPREGSRAEREADAGQHLALLDALAEGDAGMVAAVVRSHFLPPG